MRRGRSSRAGCCWGGGDGDSSWSTAHVQVFSCDGVERYGGVALELPLSQCARKNISVCRDVSEAAVVIALLLWIVLGVAVAGERQPCRDAALRRPGKELGRQHGLRSKSRRRCECGIVSRQRVDPAGWGCPALYVYMPMVGIQGERNAAGGDDG